MTKALALRDQIKNYEGQFAAILPKHITPERMVRVALTAVTKTPKLADCTQESVMSCLLDCSSMGIEPDGRNAHLIPYGKSCTLIVDYKGLVDLAMRSGKISSIHADVVCENDIFEENLGQVEKHVIDRKNPRGAPYAAYSRVVMKDGAVSCQVMGKDDIESIRKRSKAGNAGPWKTDTMEMWKKTVFRRHSKWLPLSPEYRDAIAISDKYDGIVDINDKVQVSEAKMPSIDVPPVGSAETVKKPKKKKAEPVAKGEEVNIPQGDDNLPMDDESGVPDGGPFAAPINKG